MSESSQKQQQTPDAVLRRLEWTVIRRLDGVLHGDYRTLFRGYGLDLADLREYVYGDDVRHIDLSPSVAFGSREMQKRTVSAEFVAVLARVLTRHGNRVGALCYGSDVDMVIPARSGRRQVLHILHRMSSRPEPK